jgi:uncharacterized membrane protein YqaE (UPF0057 family)
MDGSGSDGILALICALTYFIPTIVGRNKRHATAICVLNILLGWTVIGWIVAMVWAISAEDLPALAQARAKVAWMARS